MSNGVFAIPPDQWLDQCAEFKLFVDGEKNHNFSTLFMTSHMYQMVGKWDGLKPTSPMAKKGTCPCSSPVDKHPSKFMQML